MLKTRLARPILVLARAMPMVRMNKPIGPFCRAKTCSTAERTADLRALARAVRRGIGMVHQHFMLIPVFTVAENVMLGIETVRRGRLDIESVTQHIERLSKQYGLQVNPRAMVKDLPVGVQQRVEILKVLYRNADILILDEPTAVLTPQEVDELFGVLHSLKSEKKSIIFITHKLREVLELCDRITVMRDGKVVATRRPVEVDRAELARIKQATIGVDVKKPPMSASAVIPGAEIFIPLEGLIDIESERTRLSKELENLKGQLEKLSKKLANADFLANAPADVVSRDRAKKTDFESRVQKLNQNLEQLMNW